MDIGEKDINSMLEEMGIIKRKKSFAKYIYRNQGGKMTTDSQVEQIIKEKIKEGKRNSKNSNWKKLINWIINSHLYKVFQSIIKSFLNFLLLVIDPWIISLIYITWYFGTLSNGDGLNKIGLIYSLLFAISSGILGGILSKRWDDFNKNTKIRAKGISSIRSLKLIRKHVLSLTDRVNYYKNNSKGENVHLDEILERCKMLDFSIKSSIENWVDILPDQANILEKTDVFDTLTIQIEELKRDLENLEISEKENQESFISRLENNAILLNRSIESTRLIDSIDDPKWLEDLLNEPHIDENNDIPDWLKSLAED